jgi:thiosulfate dehydrogenase
MNFVRAYWFPLLLLLLITIVVLGDVFTARTQPKAYIESSYNAYTNEWRPPDEKTIPFTEQGELIRYGKELIANTSKYLGPKGIITPVSNNMNCQNCHLDAGTRDYGNSFAAVASTYPRYRDRSGIVESIEFRVNDCLMRSMNGKSIDSLSTEMRAMVAYLEWLGKDVPEEVRPKGAGTLPLPFLDRAADPAKGRKVYVQQCSRCHGENGEGARSPDSTHFLYPPLWGDESYNTGAGLYRLSHFAAYVKWNMPYGVASVQNPQLNDEEAWDVAAFVNAQPRPHRQFRNDWPEIKKKPVDFPFGPYADGFSERQHKYGPFGPIRKKKAGP